MSKGKNIKTAAPLAINTVENTLEPTAEGATVITAGSPKPPKASKKSVEPTPAIPMIAGKGKTQKDAKRTGKADKDRVPIKAAQSPKSATRRGRKASGKMSGLDAAAKVLAEVGKPMTSQEVVNEMLKRGFWKTGGKTPHATIYAAIIREIAKKGSASRFRKTDRGHFTVAKRAK